MGLLRKIFPQFRKGVRLSSVLPTKQLAMFAFGWSFLYLLLWPSANEWFAIIPFIIMATKGVDITILNGLFLSALWMTYTLFITSPLYFVIGRFWILLIYLPIMGVVFYKQPHERATPLFLTIESLFWDFPLICWMKLIAFMGGRALKPFYSSITPDIAVGSMPLAIDAVYLKETKNIGLVVNMCREYPGPVREYAKYGIQQLHLPTPDVCEPAYADILRGVHEIKTFLDKQESAKSDGGKSACNNSNEHSINNYVGHCRVSNNTTNSVASHRHQELSSVHSKSKVFIHCKAGRGRAATMALCFLIATTKLSPDAAMEFILERRKVVEPYVREFRVVAKFIKRLSFFDGDFDALYVHDYALGAED